MIKRKNKQFYPNSQCGYFKKVHRELFNKLRNENKKFTVNFLENRKAESKKFTVNFFAKMASKAENKGKTMNLHLKSRKIRGNREVQTQKVHRELFENGSANIKSSW